MPRSLIRNGSESFSSIWRTPFCGARRNR